MATQGKFWIFTKNFATNVATRQFSFFSVDVVVCSCGRKLNLILLLLNKREERMVVRGGGGNLWKNICYLCTKNTGKLVANTGKHREFNLNRTWPHLTKASVTVLKVEANTFIGTNITICVYSTKGHFTHGGDIVDPWFLAGTLPYHQQGYFSNRQ